MKRWLIRSALALAVLVLAAVLAAWLWMRASLPQHDGQVTLRGLNAPVGVERDAQGVATIRASTAEDLARATGFVHGQERFFQMDLLRRSAAGEVAALVGAAAVDYDRSRRRHALRDVARQVLLNASREERDVLRAYAGGVNAALEQLAARPFEYGVLRTSPEPWRAEDSILVIFAMYFDLHDENARRERRLAALRSVYPAELADFLAPAGTEWDAPLVGEAIETPPVPGADVIDLRELEPGSAAGDAREAPAAPGSNSWAVSAALAANGRPIVANDMHLGLGLPNIWFRLRLVLAGDDGFEVTGVSLPGMPAIVAGSNGHIAWGFTNSYGDWIDLVRLETDGCDDGYRTPRGCEAFTLMDARIDVAHGDAENVTFRRTRWGPVVADAVDGGEILYALRWTAHDPQATNLRLRRFARAASVREALGIAHVAGIPPQNLVVADSAGNIAWTIAGRMPRRAGHSGREPQASSTVERPWSGWVPPGDYPVVLNPEHGRLWTANARVIDGEALEMLGDGGYALGARARRIRERLFAAEQFDIDAMRQIQLDDDAGFHARWHALMRDILDAEAIAGKASRGELRDAIERWEGRAAVDAVAYRVVREFRSRVFAEVFGGLAGPVRARYPEFDFDAFSQSEGPLWRLVSERPPHLLPPAHASWRELLLASADQVHEVLGAKGPIAQRTWGERNRVSLRHPLGGLPLLGLLVNADPRPLPGDSYMPRVQGSGFGASERFAVSPGDEASGYFHMPGGQSGHPLSPHYLAGHEDWEAGRMAPFLPGPAVHELKLLPSGDEQ